MQNLCFYTLVCSPLKKDEVSLSPASPSLSPFAQHLWYPPSQPEGSDVSGLSEYLSRGYPLTVSMSYVDHRAGYSMANSASSAIARSRLHKPEPSPCTRLRSQIYFRELFDVCVACCIPLWIVDDDFACFEWVRLWWWIEYACGSTTENGAASGYPSGTYSAYASPHAGYGGGVER